MKEREERIAEYRCDKSLDELERKWRKAKGRHSNRFWCIEQLDLARAVAREFAKIFRTRNGI